MCLSCWAENVHLEADSGQGKDLLQKRRGGVVFIYPSLHRLNIYRGRKSSSIFEKHFIVLLIRNIEV